LFPSACRFLVQALQIGALLSVDLDRFVAKLYGVIVAAFDVIVYPED
jgi:hypothetical protein